MAYMKKPDFRRIKEMKKFKRLIAGVLLAAMTLSLCACGNTEETAQDTTQAVGNAEETQEETASTGELTTVKIGIDTEVLAFLQIIAQEKGFFEENGIDAELTSYAAGIETINAVVLGEVQIGAAYDYAACTRLAEKTNLRLVSSLVVDSPDSMWYDTTVEGAAEPKDFAGQKIAVLQGTREEYLWAKELEYAGLTNDDVEYEYFGSNAEKITAFVSGEADAVMGSKPFKEQLDVVENKTTINDLGGINVASQGYVLADSTLLEEQPEVVAGYLKALQEAMDYIDTDIDDAAQICADYLTLQKEDVISAFGSYNYEVRFLQEDYDRLQDIADWCYQNGVTDEIQVKDYMNIESVSEAFPDKVTYEEK